MRTISTHVVDAVTTVDAAGLDCADTLWQITYFYFVLQLRAEKIKEGRATSFTYMINDKKRLVGKIANKLPPHLREAAFIVSVEYLASNHRPSR